MASIIYKVALGLVDARVARVDAALTENTKPTQGIKAAVISSDLTITAEAGINYDTDMPHYKTEGGVHAHEDGTVTQPTVMWVEALDLLMAKLKADGVDFGSVAAVSGSGQQHGSVYWKKGAESTLGSLSAGSSIPRQQCSSAPIRSSPPTSAGIAAREKRAAKSALLENGSPGSSTVVWRWFSDANLRRKKFTTLVAVGPAPTTCVNERSSGTQ